MLEYYYKIILIYMMISIVTSEIPTSVNYQPIKYSHIHMEFNYLSSDGYVKKEIDYTQQNILLTEIYSKTAIHVTGRLIVVKSNDIIDINSTIATRMSNINGACSRITTISDIPWIALVLKGGKCSIKEKLYNVLRYSNASAVIILDKFLTKTSERYDFNNNVGIRLTDISIPLSILFNETMVINASITVNNFYVDGFISRTSVLFVSISFILLMVISLIWLVFYYIQRFRYIHAKERLSRRLANAAKKALDKIPLKVLSTFDKEVSNDYDQCAICIDNYYVGETIRILPCKHIFHKVCIDSWLIEQRSCPMCKVDILKACGVLNVSSSVKSTTINHGLWVSNTTAAATAALLGSGLTDESVNIETIGVHPEARCRRGHSTFLQRYRERYGLHHCHRGHRRDHFHKLSRHFHEHRTIGGNVDKSQLTANPTPPVAEPFSGNHLEAERIDLISESQASMIKQHNTSLHISIPDNDDESYCRKVSDKLNDLHRCPEAPVQDICEFSSDITNGECEVCDRHQINSTQTSTTCSCETCSDCPSTFVDCPGHYSAQRQNQNAGIGSLLKCCMTSNSTLNNLPSNNRITDHSCWNVCGRDRSSVCSFCDNTISSVCQHNSSKSVSTKPSHCHVSGNHKNSQSFQLNVPTMPCGSNNKNRLYYKMIDIDAMALAKNRDKSGTIDSFNKSSMSDEFDFEADNGSSSIELSAPAMKLTVLPPQVQCHQGPPTNTESQQTNVIDGQIDAENYPSICD